MQFGFREHTGCEDAISFLANLAYSSLDRGKLCLGIFLVVAKAFDSISHELLLSKLERIIGKNTFSSWFKSCLHNRPQIVKLNKLTSDPNNLKYGIPQGTVLGPILFSIYINELLELNTCANIIAFADDTVLFIEGDNWKDVETKANLALANAYDWFTKNNLSLNYQKSVFVPFSLNKANSPNNIEIQLHSDICDKNKESEYCRQNCRKLNRVGSTKYLGVIFDEHLK